MLDLRFIGDDVLSKKCTPIEKFDDELMKYIDDMFIAMDAGRGIGLAAPQVGRSERFFIIKIDDGIKRVFINPEIIETSIDLSSFEEGCLSIPGVYAKLKRPSYLTLSAFNEKGKPFRLDADDLLARVILHENDHLNGTLFVDRLEKPARERLLADYEKHLKM